MKKELRQLKNKRFWLTLLKNILGWLAPKLKKWALDEIADLESKIRNIDL